MNFESLDIQLGADLSGFEAGIALAATKVLKLGGIVSNAAQAAGAGFQAFVQQAATSGDKAAAAFAAGFNSVNGKVSKTFDDLEKRQEQYEKGFGRLGQSFSSIGSGLTTAITAPLTLLAGASLKTAGDLGALELGFRAIYKGAGDAGVALKETQALAKLPGLGLEEAVQGSIRLQAVGFSAEDAAKSLRAFGNAIATTGGGKADLDRVTVQLGQLSAKGKVLSQDLRPIIEAAPLVAQALQKIYGSVDSEEISKKLEASGQSSKEFVAIVTEELSKLPQVTGGLKNTFENFGDSVKLSLAKVGESINKSLNVEGFINGLADKLTGLAESFASLSPGAQKFIVVSAGLAAALGPVLLGVGALLTALPSMAAGFGILTTVLEGSGAAMLAFATNPVTLAVAALAALAAGVYYVATANSRAQDAYDQLARKTDATVSSVSNLSARYQELSTNTNRNAAQQQELVNVMNQLDQALPGVAKQYDDLGNVVALDTKHVQELTAALLDQKAAQATLVLPNALTKLDELKTKYKGLKDQLDVLNKTGTIAVTTGYDEGGNSYVQTFKRGSEEVNRFRAELTTTNVALLKQQDYVNSLRGSVASLASAYPADSSLSGAVLGGGNIESTIETLERLRKKRDDLVTKRDTTDALGSNVYNQDSAEIKRLNELIAKYEALGKAAKKGVDEVAKAFAETNNKVAAVDVRVKLNLLSQDDGLSEKISAITAGIEKVTNLKVGANDSRLRSLTNQLTTLITKKQQLDASFGKSLPLLQVSKDVDKLILDKIQSDLDKAKLKAKVEFQVTGDAVKLAQDLAAAQKQAQDSIIDQQVDPQNGQAKTITTGVKPLEIDAKNLESLKEYKQTMSEITAQQAAFGAGFNASAAAMQATGQRLQDLISLGKAATPEFDALKKKFQELKLAADFDNVLKNAQSGFANLLADVGTVVADNLVAVIAGTESVGDGLTAIFAGVLGAVGGFLVDLGKQLIVVGLLNSAFLAVSTNPALAPFAIAIGAAAIAAGSVFKAISSSASKSIGSGGGGGGYAPPSVSTGASPGAGVGTKPSNLNITVSFDPIVLRADYDALSAVSEVGAYRIKRRN